MKIKALLISALVSCIVLSACTSSKRFEVVSLNSKPTNSVTKTKLRFISSWGGADSKSVTLQDVLNKFMEDNPSIEIVNESMFGDDFLIKIKTDFASGYTPDVFGLWPGSDIRALISAGMVADLTDILNKETNDGLDWKLKFDPNNWNYTTFNGKIYGLPLEIIYEGLYINRDLFENYNVNVPTNYEELKEAIIKFKSYNIIPIAFNCKSEGTYLYQNIIAKLGGKEGTEKPFTETGVNSCYIDAMNYVKELYQMDAFPPNALKMSSRERNDLFKYKKAAMLVQGSWFNGDDELGDYVDIVPFPNIKGGKAKESSIIYGFGCGTFYMSKNAYDDNSKREASIKLLKRLTSSKTVSDFSMNTGMLSNVDIHFNISTPRRGKDTRKLKISEGELLNSDELIGPPDSFVNRAVWEGIIVPDFAFFLEGKKTAEEIWERAKKAYDSLDYK